MSEADILEMRKVSPSSFFNPPFGILLNSYVPEAKRVKILASQTWIKGKFDAN